MTREGATVLVAALGAALLLACGDDSAQPEVPGAEFARDCSQRVEGRLPDDWRSRSVAAGPIAFYPARILRDQKDVQPHPLHVEKVLAVVEPGESATVVVPARERGHMALIYDPRVWGRWNSRSPRLADGRRIVRLTACRYEQPHTQFNGGFIVRWPHCGRLDVYAGGERIEAAIPFGRSCERR